ncbi:MAG: hypothetical protein HYR76_14465 [Ignavibacteria bacterium]|nr:hypothetical protein [Ignavibacteria bacterium]MBI3766659.1 hypothetical protein [Ignavibacteriales bacterium]
MAKAQRVTYFKAHLNDRPGELLNVLKELKAKNVSLSGVWGFATAPGKAELYVVAKNPDKLRKVWQDAGILAEEKTAFMVKGADRTGALLPSLEALSNAGINIVTTDAIAVSGQFGSYIWVNDVDVSKAAEALGAK